MAPMMKTKRKNSSNSEIMLLQDVFATESHFIGNQTAEFVTNLFLSNGLQRELRLSNIDDDDLKYRQMVPSVKMLSCMTTFEPRCLMVNGVPVCVEPNSMRHLH